MDEIRKWMSRGESDSTDAGGQQSDADETAHAPVKRCVMPKKEDTILPVECDEPTFAKFRSNCAKTRRRLRDLRSSDPEPGTRFQPAEFVENVSRFCSVYLWHEGLHMRKAYGQVAMLMICLKCARKVRFDSTPVTPEKKKKGLAFGLEVELCPVLLYDSIRAYDSNPQLIAFDDFEGAFASEGCNVSFLAPWPARHDDFAPDSVVRPKMRFTVPQAVLSPVLQFYECVVAFEAVQHPALDDEMRRAFKGFSEEAALAACRAAWTRVFELYSSMKGQTRRYTR